MISYLKLIYLLLVVIFVGADQAVLSVGFSGRSYGLQLCGYEFKQVGLGCLSNS